MDIINAAFTAIIKENEGTQNTDPRQQLLANPLKAAGELNKIRTRLRQNFPELVERSSINLAPLTGDRAETEHKIAPGSRTSIERTRAISVKDMKRKHSQYEKTRSAKEEFFRNLEIIEKQSDSFDPDQEQIKTALKNIKNILQHSNQEIRDKIFSETVNTLTPLGRAIQLVNVDLVKLFLGAKADGNVKAEGEKYPIHLAAEYAIKRDKEKQKYQDGQNILRLIIDCGADVNKIVGTINAVNTPLHCAASSGNIGAIKLLLAQPGIDPSIGVGLDMAIIFLDRAAPTIISNDPITAKYLKGEGIAAFLMCGKPLFPQDKPDSAKKFETIILKWFREASAKTINSYSYMILPLLSPELALYADVKNREIDIEGDDDDKPGTSRARRISRIRNLVANGVNLYEIFDNGVTALQIANREDQNDVVIEIVEAHKQKLKQILDNKNDDDLKQWLENAINSVNIPAFKIMVFDSISLLDGYIHVDNKEEEKKYSDPSQIISLFHQLREAAISKENLSKKDGIERMIGAPGVSTLQKIMTVSEFHEAMRSPADHDSKDHEATGLKETTTLSKEIDLLLTKNLGIESKYISNFVGLRFLINKMKLSEKYTDKNKDQVFEKLEEIADECQRQNLSLAFLNRPDVMDALYQLASPLALVDELQLTESPNIDHSITTQVKKIAVKNPTFEVEMRMAAKHEDHYRILQLAGNYESENKEDAEQITTRTALLQFLVKGLHDQEIEALQTEINSAENSKKTKSKFAASKNPQEIFRNHTQLKKLKQESAFFRHILAVTITDPQTEVDDSYIQAVETFLNRNDNEPDEIDKVFAAALQKITTNKSNKNSAIKLGKVLYTKANEDLNRAGPGGYKWLYDAYAASLAADATDEDLGLTISRTFFHASVGKSDFKKFVTNATKIMLRNKKGKGGNIEDLSRGIRHLDSHQIPYYSLKLEVISQLFEDIITNARVYIQFKSKSNPSFSIEGNTIVEPKLQKLIRQLTELKTEIDQVKKTSDDFAENKKDTATITDNRNISISSSSISVAGSSSIEKPSANAYTGFVGTLSAFLEGAELEEENTKFGTEENKESRIVDYSISPAVARVAIKCNSENKDSANENSEEGRFSQSINPIIEISRTSTTDDGNKPQVTVHTTDQEKRSPSPSPTPRSRSESNSIKLSASKSPTEFREY